LFEKADTVTFYSDSDVPALLQPKPEPLPAGAPNATG
jgi:hypothetical protein